MYNLRIKSSVRFLLRVPFLYRVRKIYTVQYRDDNARLPSSQELLYLTIYDDNPSNNITEKQKRIKHSFIDQFKKLLIRYE